MKKTNEISLKEALEMFLENYNHKDKINQIRLQHIWENSMGRTIARHTKSLVLKNKVLSIELDSAALKNELSFAKEKIKNILNKDFNEEIIKEVRVK